MASYKLRWKLSAEKELRGLPRDAIARLVGMAEALTESPNPPGSRKLIGADQTYRIRVGDYRMIYEVKDRELLIHIIRVGHRREVYR